MTTVNILGTEYRIEIHKKSEDEFMKKTNSDAYCSEYGKFIVIADVTEKEYFPDSTTEEQSEFHKGLLRHEIIHAFLNESGLSASASIPVGAWAKYEEMIDWIAIQFPKMIKAFQSVNAI